MPWWPVQRFILLQRLGLRRLLVSPSRLRSRAKSHSGRIVAKQLSSIPAVLRERDPDLAALVQILIEKECHTIAHACGTLMDHLLGVWRILAAWNQPVAVCRAGLFHNVYATDAFLLPLLDPQKDREWLAHTIGPEAERAVHVFCSISRPQLWERLNKAADASVFTAQGIDVDSFRTETRIHLSPNDLSCYAAMEMANRAEQGCDAWTMRPELWLARASQLAVCFAPGAQDAPPVFDGCRRVMSEKDEGIALQMYLSLPREDDRAEAALKRLCQLNPWVAEPQILLARLESKRGQVDEARARARAAVLALENWGEIPWDRRRSAQRWRRAAEALT